MCAYIYIDVSSPDGSDRKKYKASKSNLYHYSILPKQSDVRVCFTFTSEFSLFQPLLLSTLPFSTNHQILKNFWFSVMGQLEQTLTGDNNDGRLNIMLQTFSLVGIHQYNNL